MGNWFKYNGISSESFGIKIEQKRVLDTPDYDREFISIPGRDGDIIKSNKRYSNVIVSYTCFLNYKNSKISKNEVLRNIKAWLFSSNDEYAELTDSYDTETFRYATIASALSIDEQLNKLGYFTVMFNCQPYKYFFDGQEEIVIDSKRGNITNEFAVSAYPLIRVMGYGTFGLNVEFPDGNTWSMSTVQGSKNYDFYIDCKNRRLIQRSGGIERGVAYAGVFPYLPPAKIMSASNGNILTNMTVVQFEKVNLLGSLNYLSVIPNWRCL